MYPLLRLVAHAPVVAPHEEERRERDDEQEEEQTRHGPHRRVVGVVRLVPALSPHSVRLRLKLLLLLFRRRRLSLFCRVGAVG